MLGVEIDMVVSNSLEAINEYESIFEIIKIEVTNYEKGLNEVVFTMYGTRFHLLDENPKYQLIAPRDNDSKPIWFNIVVTDIKETFQKAMLRGCKEIQPLTEMPEMGIINAMFLDSYGHLWMLHQITKEVSLSERCKIMDEKIGL